MWISLTSLWFNQTIYLQIFFFPYLEWITPHISLSCIFGLRLFPLEISHYRHSACWVGALDRSELSLLASTQLAQEFPLFWPHWAQAHLPFPAAIAAKVPAFLELKQDWLLAESSIFPWVSLKIGQRIQGLNWAWPLGSNACAVKGRYWFFSCFFFFYHSLEFLLWCSRWKSGVVCMLVRVRSLAWHSRWKLWLRSDPDLGTSMCHRVAQKKCEPRIVGVLFRKANVAWNKHPSKLGID